MSLIPTLALLATVIGGLLALVLIFRQQGKDSVIAKEQKERADVAEKRLDIANRPDASVDDVTSWLSGDK